MTPERESLRDFDRARRKALVQRILSYFTGRSPDLLPFEQVREQLRLSSQRLRALREIPLDQILGSVDRYRDLLEHIAVHRYYLGRELEREIPYTEAVTSWYDKVYQPIVEAIEESGVLAHFPGRTEADLYVWISRWQHVLNERYSRSLTAQEVVGDFGRQHLLAYEVIL